MSHKHQPLISRIAIAALMGVLVASAVPTLITTASAAPIMVSAKATTAPGQAKFGQSGPAVVALQQAIMRNGFSLRGGATGKFDARTRKVLKTFQKVVGLRVTGVVDAQTANVLKLNSTTTQAAQGTVAAAVSAAPATNGPFVKRLPKRGAGSTDVVIVQKALMSAGVRVAGGADGIFGKATTRAIRAFQKARGMSVSGKLDQQTAIALGVMAAPVTPAVATPTATSAPASTGGTYVSKLPVQGQRGTDVVLVQGALIADGITVRGGADGIFGAATARAISDFQKKHGLAVTGRLDDATALRLGVIAPPSIQLAVFPVQGPCGFSNTWQAPRDARKHEGVDIIAPEGNLIYAVADGTITVVYDAARHSRSGNGIRITTADGTYFFYAHLQKLAAGIAVGTQVKAGQIIGYNGKTGNTSTPHLHFEIHPGGGAAIDPTSAVAAVNGCHITTPLPQP